MINVGIVGAAGYSGLELIKLLLNHSEVVITKLFGSTTVGNFVDEVHPALRGMISLEIQRFSVSELEDVDVLFVALPSGQSMSIIAEAYGTGVKIIDLGGDFRLYDVGEYKKYYNHDHLAPELLKKAAYGLSEWNEEEIKNASLISNPGCYPTSAQLPLIPLLKNGLLENDLISIVSYSGTSGAGKSVTPNMLFGEVNESVRAYKVGSHQHIPEIKQYLEKFSGVKSDFSFVPHLLPVTRGIYTTLHAKVKPGITDAEINDVYRSSYCDKPFIRLITRAIPELKDVVNTNFCDISFKVLDNKTIVIFSAIDNLMKGAAGQAIQNMNIMFGLQQTEGLLRCIGNPSRQSKDKKKSLQIK